ncbi:uncharacterized protein LOC106667893 isoform X2 [Cimex lectularius]|uniref:Uncharacterized protein n=1 Tax=Cimex lectularius TaxID=79782 RepID=A0A8I6RVJ2_CIMLE|nr:uncharacterized protein LOC106667893 isoform X2 [Cimex lectularius]
MKDNLTIMLISETMYFSTSIGFLLYAVIFVILFIKRQEFGTPFISFMAQRVFFFAAEYLGSINLHKYRSTVQPNGDEDDWCCPKPDFSKSGGKYNISKDFSAKPSREQIIPLQLSSRNLADSCSIERRLAGSHIAEMNEPGQRPPYPPPVSNPDFKPAKMPESKKKNDYLVMKNAPSALKFLKPCPRTTAGFAAPTQFTGQECFKTLEGGRSPGTGGFGSSVKYTGYPPVRGCQSCGTPGGQTWQSKGTLRFTSGRPISAADLEGIRNIRGLGIGFPGSLGLCKDMPGPGTYGGTYTARQTPAKGATSVPKCF